jgi:hypothetical protein
MFFFLEETPLCTLSVTNSISLVKGSFILSCLAIIRRPECNFVFGFKSLMGILPRDNQLWVDNPRLVNFWVKTNFPFLVLCIFILMDSF